MSSDPLLQAIRYVQSHNTGPETAVALDTLHKRLQKIAKHPFESKYRLIQASDAAYHKKIGHLTGSTPLIEHAGFVKTSESTWELKPSAEAWPKLMQATALVSQAVRAAQQSVQMNNGQRLQQQQQQATSGGGGGSGSVSTGKSGNSKSSLRTATTISTSASSSPDFTQGPPAAQPRPNNSGIAATNKKKEASSRIPQHAAQQLPQSSSKQQQSTSASAAPSAGSSSAVAKLKAAAAKAKQQAQAQQQAQQPTSKSKSFSKLQQTSAAAQPPSENSAASSAIAKIKAAAAKAKQQQQQQAPPASPRKNTKISAAPMSPQKEDKTLAFVAKLKAAMPASPQKEANPSAATNSAIAKLKAAAAKAKKDGSNNNKPATPPPSASVKAKFKAAALKAAKDAKKQEQQQQPGPSSPLMKSPVKQQSTPATPGGSALAKFKAAARLAAANNNSSASQLQLPANQAAARQNPLRLAALRAAADDDDNRSVRSERSAVSLRDLALHNSATNLHNSGSKLTLAKFKAAAQQVQAQQQQQAQQPVSAANRFKQAAMAVQAQNNNNAAAADPRSRFQNAAQAMMMQNNKMQAPPPSPGIDPRLRFQNAAQAMMMQQKVGAAQQDPRARFQGAAMMAMMMQQHQNQPPPSPGGKNMTAAARWKMAGTVAQATARMQAGANKARMGSSYDGLSYPSASDANDGLSYPTAGSDDGLSYPTAKGEPNRSVRRSRSFEDGAKPFMLQTDSGRSLMSSSSYLGNAPGNGNSMALVPASPRRGLSHSKSMGGMPQQSMRGLMNPQQSMRGGMGAPQQSMRGLNAQQSMRGNMGGSMRGLTPQQSMRGGVAPQQSMRGLNAQQSMRGGMGGPPQQSSRGLGMPPGRPGLERESSLTLLDLQRSQVMGMTSSRGISIPRAQSVRGGGSVCGSVNGSVNGSVRGGGSIRGGSMRGGMMGGPGGTPTDIVMKDEPKDEVEVIAEKACSCVSSLVSWVTLAELSMDLIATVLSFKQMGNDFSCCDKPIDYGALTLAVTVPYFSLIVIELLMLGYSIFGGGGKDHDKNNNSSKLGDSFEFDDESEVTVQWQCTAGEALSWVVCLNPFLGCLITWTLMYEIDSKNDALLILGIEGGAIALMFLTMYLERNELSTCTMMVHLIPLVPFTVTCFVVWYYLEKGGICFIMKENTYWFYGCELCADGWPPNDSGRCPDGDLPIQDTFCAGPEEQQFCYFSY